MMGLDRGSVTIHINPDDEQLIRKRVQSGAFSSVEEVIHRALESQDAEETWLQDNRTAIDEKIERALGQFERGEGLTPEESLALLESRKAAWRASRK